MLIYDRAAMTSREKTPEGYLKVTARLSRTGIQTYYRGELGLDGNARDVIRVYRPPEEVFDKASLNSFALKPVTDDHPPEHLNAANVRGFAVGWSGESIVQDGDYTRGTLLITDAAMIDKIESGKSEVSNGYDTELELTAGVSPAGAPYDAIQRKIRGNHIAIVDAGRCGGECRIDDRSLLGCGGDCDCASCKRQNKESEMTDKPKAKLVDGVPVQTLDEAFEVIERKDKLLAESKDSLVALRDKLLAQQSDHSKAVEDLEATVADLQSKLSDSEVEKKAEQRVELIMKASDYLPDDYDTTGKSSAQIAKDAIVTASGSADIVSKKSDDQILGMFELLDLDNQGGQQLGAVVTPRNRQRTNDTGYNDYMKRLGDAWKGDQAKSDRAA